MVLIKTKYNLKIISYNRNYSSEHFQSHTYTTDRQKPHTQSPKSMDQTTIDTHKNTKMCARHVAYACWQVLSLCSDRSVCYMWSSSSTWSSSSAPAAACPAATWWRSPAADWHHQGTSGGRRRPAPPRGALHHPTTVLSRHLHIMVIFFLYIYGGQKWSIFNLNDFVLNEKF